MIVGYARVSNLDQNLGLQRGALEQAGCECVFEDHVSGASNERPGWSTAKSTLGEGETLVVWGLDPLGRSLKHLIDTVNELDAQGIGFKSLNESLDTTTPGGRLVFHIFDALAEFERELIRERTHAGLAAARARGRKGGRPRKLVPRQVATARTLLGDGKHSVTKVADMLGVSRNMVYRALREDGKWRSACEQVVPAPQGSARRRGVLRAPRGGGVEARSAAEARRGGAPQER